MDFKGDAITLVIHFRDTFVYATSAERKGLENVVKILSEVLLRPQLKDSEVRVLYFYLIWEVGVDIVSTSYDAFNGLIMQCISCLRYVA